MSDDEEVDHSIYHLAYEKKDLAVWKKYKNFITSLIFHVQKAGFSSQLGRWLYINLYN